MSYYERMEVKELNRKKWGKTGKNLLRLYFKGGEELRTSEFCPYYDRRNGNDHNSLMMLKNGGFIEGEKDGWMWRWSITKKGLEWVEKLLKGGNLKDQLLI